MRVSLSIIARDEETNLRACVESVGELADEIVVVDTGSVDSTREIATSLGAVVVDFPWNDSFSDARNAGLDAATGQWIFWMDADDRLDAQNRQRLRDLFSRLPDENVAFTMKCLSASPTGSYAAEHIRLFRNRPDVRWEYRIHEQIGYSVRRSGGKMVGTDIVIHHTGYRNPTIHRQKMARNLVMLQRERDDRPNDAFVLFNLGWALLANGRSAESLEPLHRSLQLAKPEDSFVRRTFGQLVRAHHQLGQRGRSLAVCREGQQRFPDFGELVFMDGLLSMEMGDLPAAEQAFLRLLKPAAGLVSDDTGLLGYKSRQNLGVVYRRQGRLDEAEQQFAAILKDVPGFTPAQNALNELRTARGQSTEQSQRQPMGTKKVLYLGWLGHNNVGDEVLFRLFKEGFEKQWSAERPESNCQIDGYSESAASQNPLTDYDLVVLGGGSLMRQKYWIDLCAEAQELGVPVVCWGTGLDGDYKPPLQVYQQKLVVGEGMAKTMRAVVGKMRYVSCRGPYTKAFLTRIGIEEQRVNEVGDPALFVLPEAKELSPDCKRILVTWGTSGDSIFGQNEAAVADQLAAAMQTLMQRGYDLTLAAVWTDDVPAVDRLAERFPRNDLRIVRDAYKESVIVELIRESRLTINLKLHPNVFSAALGRPFVSLAYRGKCFDFAETVDALKCCVPTDEASAKRIIDTVQSVEENYAALRIGFLNAKAEFNRRLQKGFGEIIACV